MHTHPTLALALLLLLSLAACRTPSPPPAPQPPTAVVIVSPSPSPPRSPSAVPSTPLVVATSSPHHLITSSPTPTPRPFSLLFASDRDGAGALYRQDEAGRVEPIPLPDEVESAWEPAVHPDGGSLLFTGRRGGQSDIAWVEADGRGLRWLTDHPSDDHSPAWSWDGTRIAWVSERESVGQIWLMDSAGGDPTRLRGPHGDLATRHPAWAADGTLYFTALDDLGLEELYHHDPATGISTQKTFWPLKVSQPTVSPTGRVAFIGWTDNLPWRGLYTLGEGGQARLEWSTTRWIGSPTWSADEKWLLYTQWRNDGGGHDLWAIAPTGGSGPVRLSAAPSWESDPAPLPRDPGSAPPAVQATPPAPPASDDIILGFNVANLDNAYLSHEMGFGWTKGFAFWERIEAEEGRYNWVDVDNTVEAAEQAGLKLFLRVDRTPTWARPPDTPGSHPPTDLDAFARYLEALATRYRGRVAAYEFWNEPNLGIEWGGKFPDPAYYVEMLRVARPALLRGDPNAKLVVGALAVTETGEQSMNELVWMEGFYQALGDTTPRPYDAFSTHPYGFGNPPDLPQEAGLGLRRLEQHRATMEAWGDFSPLWLTELGYTRHTPAWNLGDHAAFTVSDEVQGEYIVGTLDWIEQQYPYVEAVFFFNLDFSTVDWYRADEPMRSFAILDATRRPLPAFIALRERWRR